MTNEIAGPTGMPEDERGDASGGAYTNPRNGLYVVCATTITANNADTPLTFTGATTINHLYLANQSAAAIHVNLFGATTSGPLIPIEAGGWRSFDWTGMTPHLLTPAGAIVVNSATPATGIVIAAGV